MVMQESVILPMYGDDDIGQHIISINKVAPQDIFFRWGKNTG